MAKEQPASIRTLVVTFLNVSDSYARSAKRPMPTRFNKVHPALKHAGYSATTLLPGEDAAAFEKLHRALIAEFSPAGALEEDIVADIARLRWRKQNLATFRIAELANTRHQEIISETVPSDELHPLSFTDPAVAREGYRAAEEQAKGGGLFDVPDRDFPIDQ